MGNLPIRNSGETRKHEFQVLVWGARKGSDSIPQSLQARTVQTNDLSEQDVTQGLINMIDTALLMIPRDSFALKARYLYAGIGEQTSRVYDEGFPAVDAYLRENNISIVPLQRENYETTSRV